MKNHVAFLLAVLPGLVACSSTYQPARSPRIVTVMNYGTPTFVKDGHSYGTMLFGGGVVEAVRGNKRAEEEASTGENLMIGGFVVTMAGLASEVAALSVLVHDGAPPRDYTATGLSYGGLVGLVVGSVLLVAAPPHTYDAINIYNDGLDTPR